MPPSLTLSIIRYVSKVKWSNLGKGVAPPLHLGVVAIEKGAFWSPSTTVANFISLTMLISKRHNTGNCHRSTFCHHQFHYNVGILHSQYLNLINQCDFISDFPIKYDVIPLFSNFKCINQETATEATCFLTVETILMLTNLRIIKVLWIKKMTGKLKRNGRIIRVLFLIIRKSYRPKWK